MWVPQRACGYHKERVGITKSAGAAWSAGAAGRAGNAKSMGTAGPAGTAQVAVTTTTLPRSALDASPGSTGRGKTSAKADVIQIGAVSKRIHPELDRSPSPSPPPSLPPLLARVPLGRKLHSPLTNPSDLSTGAGSPSSS